MSLFSVDVLVVDFGLYDVLGPVSPRSFLLFRPVSSGFVEDGCSTQLQMRDFVGSDLGSRVWWKVLVLMFGLEFNSKANS